MHKKSTLELQFENIAKFFRVPEYVCEHYFAKPRKFRFDVAFVEQKLAIELDGGIYAQGRHSRGVGYEKDCEKFNLAVELGWAVLHYTGNQLRKDPNSIMRQIFHVLEQRK